MLTQEYLKSILEYNQYTGIFRWLISPSHRVNAGDEAGNKHPATGYCCIKIRGKLHLAHRLAFLWVTGRMPSGYVDHIDGNRFNNIWSNIRDGSMSQNQHNRPANKNNTSGVKGVHWDKRKSRWVAKIKLNGKDIHIGTFVDIISAELAVRKARVNHHGEYANHG